MNKKHSDFRCEYCNHLVATSEDIGTHHRNHCSLCLWSKHVDLKKSGDRKATCHALMRPIGITFKKEGIDKYGKPRQGELMIIHYCINDDCKKISINRIAADDIPEKILEVFEQSQSASDELKKELEKQGINLLTKSDEVKIKEQLFGN
ncbi:MAG: hypothetical protein A2W22_02655 [Candidatus Levybacteria bacterium RBG_16_35_11]|nr:MAG: hypothetical protein A2W22_02655 [Candidatus Levybacteria bacterium RBG_16_35_11]